jgi:predicted nucleic-acid-binding Zn-ribbon protein
MPNEFPNFRCARCSHSAYEVREISATGGLLSRFFDVSRHRFTSVTCERCRYTELYHLSPSALRDVVDFLGN